MQKLSKNGSAMNWIQASGKNVYLFHEHTVALDEAWFNLYRFL